MSSITLQKIVDEIMSDLPDMLKKKKLVYYCKLINDENNLKVSVSIELKNNSLNASYYDASIIINNYIYEINKYQQNIKLSIFASQCIKSDGLNKTPPDKEIEIHEISLIDGSVSTLDYPTIAKIEKEFSNTVCDSWNANLS